MESLILLTNYRLNELAGIRSPLDVRKRVCDQIIIEARETMNQYKIYRTSADELMKFNLRNVYSPYHNEVLMIQFVRKGMFNDDSLTLSNGDNVPIDNKGPDKLPILGLFQTCGL